MTYETGTATDPDNLLSKFRTFVVANGWTEDSWAVQGLGHRFHFHKGSQYINMRSYMNETLSLSGDLNALSTANVYGIGINGSDSYNGANGWNKQPGALVSGSFAYGGYCPLLASTIPAYHFFCYPDTDDVFAVIEYSTTLYQYFAFGKLQTYTAGIAGDGRFVSASSDNMTIEGSLPFDVNQANATQVRLNHLSIDSWASVNGTSGLTLRDWSTFDSNTVIATTSPYIFQTKLLPITGFVLASGLYNPIGELKHARRCSIANYAASEEFTLGGDTWKVFPALQKGGSSGQLGWAVRKVV